MRESRNVSKYNGARFPKERDFFTVSALRMAKYPPCAIQRLRGKSPAAVLRDPLRYGQEHAELLSFIRHCRSLDMALNEIRILLRFRSSPDENCGEVNALLDTHIGHVEERIAELQTLESQLRALRNKCSSERSAEHCGILQRLGGAPDDRDASGNNHVPRTHSTTR